MTVSFEKQVARYSLLVMGGISCHWMCDPSGPIRLGRRAPSRKTSGRISIWRRHVCRRHETPCGDPLRIELAPQTRPRQGFNIFTINDLSASCADGTGSSARRWGGLAASSSASRPLKSLGSWVSPSPRIRPLGQRLRSTLDPAVRKGRKEVRKWRRRHEVFVVINDIERCLCESCRLLLQASASMRRFGECHGALRDGRRLSSFLRDAALYLRSEAEVPQRLEAHLSDLERVAYEFRNVSLMPDDSYRSSHADVAAGHDGGAGILHHDDTDMAALRQESADLQVDIAVLLESALMTAQQALAEYKKMHCRLELVATEYEPLCRLEVELSSRPETSGPRGVARVARACAIASC